ncbi:hypothetical protein, partial [Helicobacter pylori]|uniref:hypothetical protein n=1 Tax=Helicobacter pylori TaxID=210 RepID=UPI0005351EA0
VLPDKRTSCCLVLKDWAYSFFFTSCFCLILTSTTFHKTLALILSLDIIRMFFKLLRKEKIK